MQCHSTIHFHGGHGISASACRRRNAHRQFAHVRDWGAATKFGKITFRIDPNGGIVETVYVEVHNWTCGGDTLTTSLQASTDPPTAVTGGSFEMTVDLGDASTRNNELYVAGTYDKTGKKFSGKWEQDAYGTTCTGTWVTAARK